MLIMPNSNIPLPPEPVYSLPPQNNRNAVVVPFRSSWAYLDRECLDQWQADLASPMPDFRYHYTLALYDTKTGTRIYFGGAPSGMEPEIVEPTYEKALEAVRTRINGIGNKSFIFYLFIERVSVQTNRRRAIYESPRCLVGGQLVSTALYQKLYPHATKFIGLGFTTAAVELAYPYVLVLDPEYIGTSRVRVVKYGDIHFKSVNSAECAFLNQPPAFTH